ncbi:hypothetical protein HPB52_011990 [Rhipicephalus sanguineus]|uniref:Uncharacterized protein n=1 Tax=Rhipicephalus sanguineus TaxID=34632 RepID=A0A9D4PKA2_RHISA|nr:hypothetical protein HPB52_011990 [Rhipicephalus sanguineus]
MRPPFCPAEGYRHPVLGELRFRYEGTFGKPSSGTATLVLACHTSHNAAVGVAPTATFAVPAQHLPRYSSHSVRIQASVDLSIPRKGGQLLGGHGAEHFPFRCAAKNPTETRNDQVCLINGYLPICNELLYDIGMELRQQRGGSVSLVCFRPQEPDVMPPPDADLNRSKTFLRWLLRIHVCIDGLKLQYKWVTAHSQVFLEELPENCRLKKLRVQFPFGDTVQTNFATLLPRLRCLEELYCYMFPSTDVLVAAVSELLRTTTSLTSLANWNTDELPGTLGEYVRGNGLLTKLVFFGEETDREELLLDAALVSNGLLELDERLFYAAANYIRATTVLRKLGLLVTNAAEDAPFWWWKLLFESISANTSIADLFYSASDNCSYTGHLASTVGLSRCITRVYYSKKLPEWDATCFIRPLSGAICDNYNLLKVVLSSNATVGAEARHWWFTIRDTTRRNSGLVELAGAFNQATAIDW